MCRITARRRLALLKRDVESDDAVVLHRFLDDVKRASDTGRQVELGGL